MQSLKPVGLPPDSWRRRSMNCIISIGVENALCAAGEMQSTPSGTPRAAAISGVTLGPGKHAAVAGLGALAELEFNQFDLRVGGIGGKLVGIEAAVVIAAAKVARADFPDQIAAVHAVVGGDGALARVMRKAAALGAGVQRQNGIGAQGPKAHGRDVEHADGIGLGTVGPTVTRKSWLSSAVGATEWFIHS